MTVLGWSEFSAAINKVVAEADAASKAIVTESSALIEKAAKGNFSGTHKKGQPHVGASLGGVRDKNGRFARAPGAGGDKPNVVTGTLRRSIRHDPIRKVGFGTWGTTVGPTAIYGRRVELGFNGSNGYPYFGPAVLDNAKKLNDIAKKHWREALTK